MSFANITPRILFVSTVLLLAICVSVVWGILVSYSAPLALALAFGVVYFVIVFLRPFYAVLALLVTLPLGPFLSLPVTEGGFLLSLVIAQTGFVAWVIRALLVKDGELFTLPLTKPVHMLMLAFLIVMTLSLINTTDLTISLRQIKRFMYYVIIYFLVTYTMKDRKQLSIAFVVLLIGYFITSILGMVEAFSGKSIYEFLGNRSLLGGALPPPVLIVSAVKLHGPAGNAEFHSFRMISFFALLLCPFVLVRSKPKKMLIAFLILLALANIIGTSYRGAVLGLTTSVLIFSLTGRIGHKGLTLATSILVIVLIGVSVYVMFPQLDVERLTKTKGEAVETVELRKNNTLIGLRMALDHPIIGQGPDGFFLRYYRYSDVLPEAHERAIKAHNTYVQVLAEYGLVGLSVFGLIIFITLRNVLRVLRRVTAPDHYLVLSVFAALCAHVAMMVGGNLLLDDNWWLLVAMGGAVERIYSAKASKLEAR
jgi:putative inorganic carbon (HCO3(-)) transporter